MFKFELNFGMYTNDVYVDNIFGSGATQTLREMRGLASEFKTYCIITQKPYNIPHFINWVNKYVSTMKISRDLEVSGRIDF